MIALVRYTLAVLLHSQRFLPPLMLFVGAAVMSVDGSDPGPVTPVYGLFAGILFACSTWFTVVLVGAEDPVRRAVTSVNSGGSRPALVATVAVALLVCLLVSGATLGLPLLIGQHRVTGADVAVGLLAQLTGASTGVAIGLGVSRLVIARTGQSLLAALTLVAFFALVKGFPPVNPLIRLLANEPDSPDLLPTTAAYAAVGVALLAVSTAFTQFVSVRRD